MNIDILTLFPEMFDAVLNGSMLGRAQDRGIISVNTVDIRYHTTDRHNRADDYPFGGGGGMVMMPQPVFDAMASVGAADKKVVYMSPRGKVLDEKKVKELSEIDEMVILCGHYEGMDQRVIDFWDAEEISIGDYILTGGEVPAMVLIDSVARLLPGVLGNERSALDESVYSGLLEHPQYTKPRSFRGLDVPEVLLSGDHRRVELWKFRKALEITRERRPDMLEAYLRRKEDFTKEEIKIIEEVCNC